MADPGKIQAAIDEAIASAPADLIVLDTLEVHHRTFETPIRVCRWPYVGPEPELFHLRLEDTAPVNPGEVVEFIGAPFELSLPEKNAEIPGTFTIRIDGINDQLDEYMKNAALDGGTITAIYRQYLKGCEEDGPGAVWAGIELVSPRLEGMTFVIEGAVLTWMSKSFGEIYTAIDYPGLVVGR
jgi:hypothetical protein